MSNEQRRQLGLSEFQAKRYDTAILAWERAGASGDAARDAALKRALAEAHFRRAMGASAPQEALPHLERAAELMPADALYAYHRGLALHRLGHAAEAMSFYQHAVTHGLSRPGTGLAIGLAALELDAQADLSGVPGVSVQDQQSLAPVAALLRGEPAAPPTAPHPGPHGDAAASARITPARQVFDGVMLLAGGQAGPARRQLFSIDARSLPLHMNAIRWHYAGVAAAREGDAPAALEAWKQNRGDSPNRTGLDQTGSVILARHAASLFRDGKDDQARAVLIDGLALFPGHAALVHLEIVEFDRAARQATQSDDWRAAAAWWRRLTLGIEAADLKRMYGRSAPITQPMLHNLALAMERIEDWDTAANAWRDLLRTKPRRASGPGMGGAQDYSSDDWAWIRERVIACYKRANAPGQAISLYRQALKAQPDDADMHLGLVGALIANDQPQAAMNEAQRLLHKHPDNTVALVMLASMQLQRDEFFASQQTMRRALSLNPLDPALRQHMAHVLRVSASNADMRGARDEARRLSEEAVSLTPDDYTLWLDWARIEFNARSPEQARACLERALETGKNEPDAYLQASLCWAIENDTQAARAVLSRAEANGRLTSDVCIQAGVKCLELARPPASDLDHLAALLFGAKPAPAPRSAAQSALEQFAHECLERAIQIGPAATVLRDIAAALAINNDAAGIPYARRHLEQAPDDLEIWLVYGLLLGAHSHVREAQEALDHAGKLARARGDHKMAREVRQMRAAVADPSFPLLARNMLSLGDLADEMGG